MHANLLDPEAEKRGVSWDGTSGWSVSHNLLGVWFSLRQTLLQHHLFQGATLHWEEVWPTLHLSRAGAAYTVIYTESKSETVPVSVWGWTTTVHVPTYAEASTGPSCPVVHLRIRKSDRGWGESSAIRDKAQTWGASEQSRDIITHVAQVSTSRIRSLTPARLEWVHAQTHAQWQHQFLLLQDHSPLEWGCKGWVGREHTLKWKEASLEAQPSHGFWPSNLGPDSTHSQIADMVRS